MITLLIEPLKNNLDLSDLDRFGNVEYIDELVGRPEPSLFSVDEYKQWLEEGLPKGNFAFVIAGSTVKIALMMSVLSDLYDEYDILVYDSVYRRYVLRTVKRKELV